MQRVTKEEAKKAFEILHQYIEDKNICSGVYEHMLLTTPLSTLMTSDNRADLSEDIVELMTIQYLAKHFDAPIYIGVEPIVKRFKKVVLEYLLYPNNCNILSWVRKEYWNLARPVGKLTKEGVGYLVALGDIIRKFDQ